MPPSSFCSDPNNIFFISPTDKEEEKQSLKRANSQELLFWSRSEICAKSDFHEGNCHEISSKLIFVANPVNPLAENRNIIHSDVNFLGFCVDSGTALFTAGLPQLKEYCTKFGAKISLKRVDVSLSFG